MDQEDQELLDALVVTRQALKGLQRQARQTLQLATSLQDRLAARELILAHRTAQERGSANHDPDTSSETPAREGISQLARAL